MRTKLYYTGYSIGFGWGQAYAVGTRADRREIRRKLGRMADVYGVFTEGVWAGFGDLAEQRADAIRAGRAPRTCNPHKLERVLERVS